MNFRDEIHTVFYWRKLLIKVVDRVKMIRYNKCTNIDSTLKKGGGHVLGIDKQSKIPVYEQLVEAFEKEIVLGIREADSMIPSVRSLSVELGINPNTVQKAYLELERRNITYSVPGVGRFVSKEGAAILKSDQSEAEALLAKAIGHMKRSEVPLEQILEMVRGLYDRNPEE